MANVGLVLYRRDHFDGMEAIAIVVIITITIIRVMKAGESSS